MSSKTTTENKIYNSAIDDVVEWIRSIQEAHVDKYPSDWETIRDMGDTIEEMRKPENKT